MAEDVNCLILFFSSRVVRKAIARVYIVMHQKQKENLRKLFKVSVLRSFFFPSSPIHCVGNQDNGPWRGGVLEKPVVTHCLKKCCFNRPECSLANEI